MTCVILCLLKVFVSTVFCFLGCGVCFERFIIHFMFFPGTVCYMYQRCFLHLGALYEMDIKAGCRSEHSMPAFSRGYIHETTEGVLFFFKKVHA